jgi:alkanesulfonate monooxygenase SsuD/methylene tetrahydromethanopterin reductase-like flavin-dependent oxidoreductase (luciferase family)
MVARETVALDHLSNGRLIFGAGLGYQALEFTPFGEEVDPKIRAEKLDEGLDVLCGLWNGEAFRFQGKHYQVEVASFLPKPVQSPRIPVWIGGIWPNRKPFQRAARWDGVYVGSEKANGEPLTLADFQAMVAYVKSNREGSEPFEIAAPGATPADPAQGAKIVQPYMEAGATWWVEAINQWVGPLEEMRARIRSGPPKV